MKKGFTLIELLIVIAIIGILVAAIAPRYVGFTDKARTAATQSNLSSLRGAITLYAGNNDGDYPADGLSDLVSTYIEKIPDNKLSDIDGNDVVNAEADCGDGNGWFYTDGVIKACNDANSAADW